MPASASRAREIWADRSITVSASTTWSWSTRPAGTSTIQRRDNRWNRDSSSQPSAIASTLTTTPSTQEPAASSNGPVDVAAHSAAQLTADGSRNAAGGRSTNRHSSPYAEACTIACPNSPLATTSAASAVEAIANTVPAVRPASTAAAAAPTTPMGTSIRVSVRPSADGSSNSTATAAHPTQSTTVPVIWTARLCGAKASPKPEPPITATTSQSTRAIQRTGDLAEACTSRQGIQRPLFTNR